MNKIEFELLVQVKLLEGGFDVAVPIDHLSRYDGVILFNGKAVKYQVKTAEMKDGKTRFSLAPNSDGKRRKYRDGEVDLFILVPRNHPELMYAVPYFGECSSLVVREDGTYPGTVSGKDNRLLDVLKNIANKDSIQVIRSPMKNEVKATPLEYAASRAKQSKSGFIGVQWSSQRGKYVCRIFNRKKKLNIYIDSSSDPRELAVKYDKKVLELMLEKDFTTNASAGLL